MAIIIFILAGIIMIIINEICLSNVKKKNGINKSRQNKKWKKRNRRRFSHNMNSKSCDRYIFIFYWIDAIYFLGLSFYLSLSGNSSFLNMNWSITLLIVLLLIEAFIVYLVVNNILAIEHVIKKLQESGSIRRKLKKKDMFF